MLTIFRGDDLAFAEFNRKVCVRFDTIQDLTGWSATFSLLDDVKHTNDISSRIWTFGYTAEETQKFPLGKTFGKLTIFDSQGRIRQMSRVEAEIVNKRFEPCIAGLIAISIDNVIADYSQMGNKPILNGKTIEGSHDGAYYGLADAAAIEAVAEKAEQNAQHIAELSQSVQGLAETVAGQVETIASHTQKIEELGQVTENLSQTVSAQGESISTNTENIAGLQNSVTELAQVVEQHGEDIAGNSEAINTLRKDTDDTFESLADGQYLLSKLLFEAEGDNENYYRIQVVMRDLGDNEKYPTIALEAVPKGGDESDSQSDDSSEV